MNDTEKKPAANSALDLVCLSHLRWNFVYQRPQHLMSRFAKQGRTFFVEEAIIHDADTRFAAEKRDDNLFVVVPHLNRAEVEEKGFDKLLSVKLAELFTAENIDNYIFWYYTPMALNFTRNFNPTAIIYDCMDELSLFKFAPPELIKNEKELFRRADLVFTGGQSLYEAKKSAHPNVYAFPSSIDAEHFRKAREIKDLPDDAAKIKHPQIGYIGVIDERIDIDLIRKAAEKRPDFQFVMIGPVVKISEDELPRSENIHYLGMKDYAELPAYLAGLDTAMMPFALNDSTKFISPTKTPEYLAAGKPVISTAIRDVVNPYGEKNLVRIVGNADEFIQAVEESLKENRAEKLKAADEFLRQTSWDKTWREMADLIEKAVKKNNIPKSFVSKTAQ